jgi:hypothetical protein
MLRHIKRKKTVVTRSQFKRDTIAMNETQSLQSLGHSQSQSKQK